MRRRRGAGPGYATIDLARIVGRGGRVIALERSSRFLSHLKAECARLGLPQVEPVEADLDASLPRLASSGRALVPVGVPSSGIRES